MLTHKRLLAYGGCATAGVALALSLGATMATVETINWRNASLPMTSCMEEKDPTHPECQKLLAYGVDPQLFATDAHYRAKVVEFRERAVQAGSKLTDSMARETLNYIGNAGVKRSVELLQFLGTLSERDEAAVSAEG